MWWCTTAFQETKAGRWWVLGYIVRLPQKNKGRKSGSRCVALKWISVLLWRDLSVLFPVRKVPTYQEVSLNTRVSALWVLQICSYQAPSFYSSPMRGGSWDCWLTYGPKSAFSLHPWGEVRGQTFTCLSSIKVSYVGGLLIWPLSLTGFYTVYSRKCWVVKSHEMGHARSRFLRRWIFLVL